MTNRRERKTYEQAKRAYLAGRLDRAASLATAHLESSAADPQAAAEINALMYELLACVQRDNGHEQKHLESLLCAEDQLRDRAGCDPDLLGRIQFQIAASLIDLQG